MVRRRIDAYIYSKTWIKDLIVYYATIGGGGGYFVNVKFDARAKPGQQSHD